MDLDPKTVEIFKRILIVLSVVTTVFAIASAFLTTYLVMMVGKISTIAPNLMISVCNVAIVLISSAIIGEIVPILAYVIAANCAVITWALLLALVNS